MISEPDPFLQHGHVSLLTHISGMAQRQGLGKKLMGALLRHVRKRGPSSFGAFPRPQQVQRNLNLSLQYSEKKNMQACSFAIGLCTSDYLAS